MNAAASEFDPPAEDAVRGSDGVLVGIVGPSSSGKTYTAMRLAKGIQQVVGGDFSVIDTENGRAKHYADRFKFRHVPLRAPFSPLRYLEAVRASVRAGIRTIVIDSTSHEHAGSGGVIEWHEAEMQRLSGGDPAKAERIKMLAWAKPKAARTKFINEILQMNVNLILTFRAKEKLKIVRGKDPIELGWMPIAGDEFIYEMVLQCLLKPNSRGVPTWDSDFEGERSIIKMPEQFLETFKPGVQLTEEHGRKLAEWAAGGAKPTEFDELLSAYVRCPDEATFEQLEKRRSDLWKKPSTVKPRLKEAAETARRRLDEAKQPPAGGGDPPSALDWESKLRSFCESGKSADLDAAWQECQQAFGGNVPMNVEDAYNITREQLVERETRPEEF